MAKKRPEAGPPEGAGDPPKKRPPSRENTRYVAIPLRYYELLEQYAKDHSDEDQGRSISWVARKAIRKFLEGEGYLPPPPAPPT